MTQGFNNLSAYQQMLADTSPSFVDEYGIANGIVQPKVKPQVVKNQNLSFMKQLMRNANQTGRVVSSGAKAVGKVGGKAVPVLGAGLTGYDVFRSNAIADELEKINKVKEGTIPQGAIDYYRNKARAIGAGAGLGGVAGGILGSGAFSIPGAAVGAGTGGGLADGIYQLFQSRNPYKEYILSPDEARLLEQYYKGVNNSKGNEVNNPVANNNVPPGTVPYNPEGDGYDLSDIPIPNNNSGQIAKANALANAVGQQQEQIQPKQQLQPQQNGDNEEIVNQYMAMLQNRNAPYIKELERYIRNYPDLLRQSARNDLYFYGANLAKGLNPKAGEKFNQLKNYENMLGAVKAIEDVKTANQDYAREAIGNMAIANDIGLPSEAAFANKNLLSAYSWKERDAIKQAIANANNIAKMYGIDTRAALQLALQQMKNENALNVANTYMGNPVNVPAQGLTQQGTAQQPQQPMSLEESVYSQIKRK